MRGVALLALSACTGGERTAPVTPAAFFDEVEVERIEVASSVGAIPHRVGVRAVNLHGAAVPSDAFDGLRVDGVAVSVAFDGFGYGAIPIDDRGYARIDGAAEPAEAWTFDAGWIGLPLDRIWQTDATAPELATAVSTGMLASEGDTVWWAGDDGPSHRVLVADGPIVGLRAANVDVDGVLDAIAWTSTTVFLLKGRAGGGMAWGGGFRAEGQEVGGAAVGDLSADNLPDVAIGWVDASGLGTLDVWEGDGLFRFTAAEPRGIEGAPSGLSIADNTGEGLAQVTVLHTTGDWSRFIRGAELQYMPIGPRAPTNVMDVPDDAELLATGDVNGDGGAEIALAGPRAPGLGRAFWFVDVRTDALHCPNETDPEVQCGTEFLPLENEVGAYYAIGDGNGEYLDDIFLLHDNRSLYAVMWDPLQVNGKYAKADVLELPAYAPFDVNDLDSDGQLDLVLAAGPLWWSWHGRGFGDTERFWAPRDIPSTRVRELLVPPFALVEADGDPATVEVIGFGTDTGDTELRVMQYSLGGGRAPLLGREVVDTSGAPPSDLAICGADVYVAAGGAVHRLSLADPSRPQIEATLEGAATRIDCGEGPGNTQLAVLDGGQVAFHQRATLTPIGAPVDAAGAHDVALGDLGAGPEARTCDDPGCSVVFWPGAPEPLFAWTDPLGTTVADGAGGEARSPGVGQLSVVDADGDGRLDLLSVDPVTGLVSLHRRTDEGVADAELFRVPAGSSALAVADGDGDGQNDLWWLDPAQDLLVSRSAPVLTTGATP